MSANDSSITSNATGFERLGEWVPVEVLNILLLCVSFWVFLSFLVYGIKNKKWRRERRSHRLERIIYFFGFLSPLFVVLRLVMSHVTVIVGFDPTNHFGCEVAYDISTVTYLLALAPAYLCLWVRQKALYADKWLGDLKTKVIIAFNWICLFLIVGSLGASVVVFVVIVSYHASDKGCVRANTSAYTVSTQMVVILAALLIVGQGILLGLLIYPLRLFAKRQYNIGFCCLCCSTQRVDEERRLRKGEGLSTDSSLTTNNRHSTVVQSNGLTEPNSASQSDVIGSTNAGFKSKRSQRKSKIGGNTGRRLLGVMQRSMICAVVCVASDLLAMIIETTYNANNPGNNQAISNVFYDISLVVRMMALMLQFDCRKEIANTLCCCCDKSK